MNNVLTPENLVYISFGVSLTLTVAHLIEEHQGQIWRYFGAIAGVQIDDWAGRIFFTFGLGLLLVAAAFGILYINRDSTWPILCVGFLLGGRLSDWWFSHYSKRRHYRWNHPFLENPGFFSSWLYLADAALLAYLLWVSRSAWINGLLPGAVGLIVGVMLFYAVIPTIKLIGKKFPRFMRSPRWMQDQPIPSWATQP